MWNYSKRKLLVFFCCLRNPVNIGIICKTNHWMTDNCLSTILTWQIILNHIEKKEINTILCSVNCPPKSSSDFWIAVNANYAGDWLSDLTSSSLYPHGHRSKFQAIILTNVLPWLPAQTWYLSLLLVSSVYTEQLFVMFNLPIFCDGVVVLTMQLNEKSGAFQKVNYFEWMKIIPLRDKYLQMQVLLMPYWKLGSTADTLW